MLKARTDLTVLWRPVLERGTVPRARERWRRLFRGEKKNKLHCKGSPLSRDAPESNPKYAKDRPANVQITAADVGSELYYLSGSYLVDPASSHMLVSKIKPCMSKYIPSHGETANGSLNQLWFLRSIHSYLDNCSNSRANTCNKAPTSREERFY